MKPSYEELEKILEESKREFRSADITMQNLEAQLKQSKIDADCYKKGMEASNARLVQLAAENAKLADCANFYRLGFKPAKGAFGIEYRPTEQLLDDCGNTALEAIKTPATDAFLAEVRAGALPENIAEIIDSGDLETICWRHEHYKAEDYRLSLYRFRTDRAAQLRKGVQS